jgi:hypothetical protein
LKIDLRIGFDLNISVTAEEELQGWQLPKPRVPSLKLVASRWLTWKSNFCLGVAGRFFRLSRNYFESQAWHRAKSCPMRWGHRKHSHSIHSSQSQPDTDTMNLASWPVHGRGEVLPSPFNCALFYFSVLPRESCTIISRLPNRLPGSPKEASLKISSFN